MSGVRVVKPASMELVVTMTDGTKESISYGPVGEVRIDTEAGVMGRHGFLALGEIVSAYELGPAPKGTHRRIRITAIGEMG